MDQEPRRSYICRKNFSQIYQFRIGLKDTRPPVWRRIQVPEIYTFWDLHVAIQDAMGWQDKHLHEWLVRDQQSKELTRVGISPAESEDEPEVHMDWDVPIAPLFFANEEPADYIYDFGDDWQHMVFCEGTSPEIQLRTIPAASQAREPARLKMWAAISATSSSSRPCRTESILSTLT